MENNIAKHKYIFIRYHNILRTPNCYIIIYGYKEVNDIYIWGGGHDLPFLNVAKVHTFVVHVHIFIVGAGIILVCWLHSSKDKHCQEKLECAKIKKNKQKNKKY